MQNICFPPFPIFYCIYMPLFCSLFHQSQVLKVSCQSHSNNSCRKVSRSHKKKKPGYKKKKPGYKKKSHCSSFQSYNSKPSYGKKPKYKKKKKKKKFGHHHRLFKVPKKPFGHHVHIDSNDSIDDSNERKEKKKILRQSNLGLLKNNKAFLAGHSATWLQGHSRRKGSRRRHTLRSIKGVRLNGQKQNLSLPRILKDTTRGNKRTIHIGI